MKYLIIVGDGMADERQAALKDKTPLEAAHIPTLQRLAARGSVFHTTTCPSDFACGSDIAHLSILGCDPYKYFTGRSPIEAAAMGFTFAPTDVVFRCNLLTMEDRDGAFDEKSFVSFNAGSIEGQDALDVAAQLTADAEFATFLKANNMEILATPTFRHFLVHHGASLEGLHFETNWQGTVGACSQVFPRGDERAELYIETMRRANRAMQHLPVNEKRREEGKLPANGFWLWAEGTACTLPSFKERYGTSGAVIAGVPIVKGIGALCGLETVEVEGANGEIDTNIEGKVDAAWEMLQKHDFALVHLEAPDECSHNGDLKNKLQAIEWLDSRLVTPLLARLDAAKEDYRLILISDHYTLLRTRYPDPKFLWSKTVK